MKHTPEPQYEDCSICAELTGRAGRSDDSIYFELPSGEEVGPLCPACSGVLTPSFLASCVNALAGMRPEAVGEMRVALIAFRAWMLEWYSIRGEVKRTAGMAPEDNALIDIYEAATAALSDLTAAPEGEA